MSTTLLERLENMPLDDHMNSATHTLGVVHEQEDLDHMPIATQVERVQSLLEQNRAYFKRWDDFNRMKSSIQNRIYGIIRQETNCTKSQCSKWHKRAFSEEVADDPLLQKINSRAVIFEEDRKRYAELEKGPAKEMVKCVEAMPIWEWAKDIRGCGPMVMAKLLAIWNPGNFPTIAKSWKRLGLAVIDGERQRKRTDKRLAVIHGYSPKRRSIVWQMEDCLHKGNGDGYYREVYKERREYEKEMHPEWDHVKKPGFSYQRARRYMIKRFIKNMWCEWRKLEGTYTPDPNGY